MSVTLGITLAFAAMFCWGFGDFLIQKSARRLGNWETLFLITFFGVFLLLPFSFHKILPFFSNPLMGKWVIFTAALAMLIAAIAEFESLRRGKISVVEPIWSLEIPMSIFLAFIILGEKLSLTNLILITCLLIGLVLVSVREKKHFKNIFLERGALVALGAALLMGGTNFFVGWGARETDPVFVNFIINVVLAIATGLFLFYKGKLKNVFIDLGKQPLTLSVMIILDNMAWVAFAFAMSLAQIGVAVALSESYIIIAVLLGFFVNKERLQIHQKLGLVLTIISAIILASITI